MFFWLYCRSTCFLCRCLPTTVRSGKLQLTGRILYTGRRQDTLAAVPIWKMLSPQQTEARQPTGISWQADTLWNSAHMLAGSCKQNTNSKAFYFIFKWYTRIRGSCRQRITRRRLPLIWSQSAWLFFLFSLTNPKILDPQSSAGLKTLTWILWCVETKQNQTWCNCTFYIYLKHALRPSLLFCFLAKRSFLLLRLKLPSPAAFLGTSLGHPCVVAVSQEVLEDFLRLFPLLFSANQNARFCQAVTTSFERKQWSRLSKGLRNAAKMAMDKVSGGFSAWVLLLKIISRFIIHHYQAK